MFRPIRAAAVCKTSALLLAAQVLSALGNFAGTGELVKFWLDKKQETE